MGQELADSLPGLLASECAMELDAASVESLDFILSLDNFEAFKDAMLVRKAWRTIEALELLEQETTEKVASRELELQELADMRKELDNVSCGPGAIADANATVAAA